MTPPIQFAHVQSRPMKPARKRALFLRLAIATALSTLGAATVLLVLMKDSLN
jgi:hypothetical protein